MDQFLTALRRPATNPLFLILLAVLLVVLMETSWTDPIIARVPVVVPGSEMSIEGRGFGDRQGKSFLRLNTEAGTTRLSTVTSWSDEGITLPAPLADGSIEVVRKTLLVERPSNVVAFVMRAPGLPSEPFGYQVPVQAESPWPTFRRDRRNSGRSPIPANSVGDGPWSFETGKGIFSTPIIDGNGTIYVGSADHNFYAINPDGSEKWRFETGEIIDSAGALPSLDTYNGDRTVIFPSGDGFIYHLNAEDGSLRGTFEAPGEFYNRWWEANIAVGYDATFYAGNTNFNYYAISPERQALWAFETGSNAWTNAGLADDATIYWSSLDTHTYAVDPAGDEKWRKRTLGFIAASAAVGSDGTVYVGSYDSTMYALDPATGKTKWKFKTGDHIYASAALGEDAGSTNTIYFGSTDGILYALDTDGNLRWRYDTGDPIRSSPALGAAPTGEQGEIIYFGAGNGKLYALNAQDGSRRWSFDTTVEAAELRDRNDLNGSPALGLSGIYIGGEHGHVWFMPYDYCLHDGSVDLRCSRDPGEDLPGDEASVYFVTSGGTTMFEGTPEVPPASIITLRLVVREDGETQDAWVCNSPVGCPEDALKITVEPTFPFAVESSADGHFLHVIPDGFFDPDTDYSLHVEGDYYTGGLSIGNLTLGGSRSGRFEDMVPFRTTADVNPLPIQVEDDQVTAFEWTRLAIPIPSMMPSLNQIGFDYIDWIIGAVEIDEPNASGEGKAILWAIGAERDSEGNLVADPDSDFILPLSGSYRNNDFILTNRDFNMPVTGIPIPFNLLELRGSLQSDLHVTPGATLYADTDALSIPTFGPYLVIAGLANNWFEKLLVTGTYITRPYEGQGLANQRPDGIAVASVDFTAPAGNTEGKVVARLELTEGSTYPLDQHRPAILLIDSARTEAVNLDYLANLTAESDSEGNLTAVALTIPPGTELPTTLEAVVVLDVFPLHRQDLTEEAR